MATATTISNEDEAERNLTAEDARLYAAWRGGSQRAGRVLVERYAEVLMKFFRRQLSRENDLEDLTQQTFLGCLEYDSKFRGESSFKTYLFTIARYKLYAHYRKAKREVLSGEISETTSLEFGPDPDYVLNQKREYRLLMKALRRIPLDHQIALELFHWESMSGPEIARVLGIPEGTVRGRLRRGKINLRAKIAELAGSQELLKKTTMTFTTWRLGLHEQIPAM